MKGEGEGVGPAGSILWRSTCTRGLSKVSSGGSPLDYVVRSRSTKWKRVSPYVTRHSLNTEPDTGQEGGRGRLPFGFVAFPSARLAEDRARARARQIFLAVARNATTVGMTLEASRLASRRPSSVI